MKIENILHELNMRILEEYGVGDAIHKVILSHEALDRVLTDFYKTSRMCSSFTPSGCNDLTIANVRLEAREPDR